MRNKLVLQLSYGLLVIYILVLLFSSLNCTKYNTKIYFPFTNSSNATYKVFGATNKSIPYFSFEYPSYYRLVDETQGNNNPSLNLGLYGHTREEFFNGEVKTIRITITNYSSRWLGFPDAKTEMNEKISERKWSLNRNFRLLEKHKAGVDGVEGWETVMTFRERPAPDVGPGEPRVPIFVVARDLFFDYLGITWQISLYTDADSYKQQTKADFEHILQTFKFSK